MKFHVDKNKTSQNQFVFWKDELGNTAIKSSWTFQCGPTVPHFRISTLPRYGLRKRWCHWAFGRVTGRKASTLSQRTRMFAMPLTFKFSKFIAAIRLHFLNFGFTDRWPRHHSDLCCCCSSWICKVSKCSSFAMHLWMLNWCWYIINCNGTLVENMGIQTFELKAGIFNFSTTDSQDHCAISVTRNSLIIY